MSYKESKRILERGASPRIKRPTHLYNICSGNIISTTEDTPDTASSLHPSRCSGVHNFPDSTRISYVQSDDPVFQYRNFDNFSKIRPCKVQLRDIFDYNDSKQHCIISKCGAKNCKTCNILITDALFKSPLTNKTFNTRSYDDLCCKSKNLIYGLECNLCGLIYIGETKRALNQRINEHRSGVNNNESKIVYNHFNQPDHSILSMKVRIIEKIYHPSNDPGLSTPYRKQREEFWIRKLGTATPYGCNDNINSIGNLSSPRCSSGNVMNLLTVVLDGNEVMVIVIIHHPSCMMSI